VQIEAEHLRRDEPAVTEVLIVLLAALLLLAGTGFLRVFQMQVVLARNAQALPLMPEMRAFRRRMLMR
jgi:hypothetical protein